MTYFAVRSSRSLALSVENRAPFEHRDARCPRDRGPVRRRGASATGGRRSGCSRPAPTPYPSRGSLGPCALPTRLPCPDLMHLRRVSTSLSSSERGSRRLHATRSSTSTRRRPRGERHLRRDHAEPGPGGAGQMASATEMRHGYPASRGVPPHQRVAAVRVRADRRAEDGVPASRRRRDRPRVRQSRPAVADGRGREARRGGAQPAQPSLLDEQGHPEAARWPSPICTSARSASSSTSRPRSARRSGPRRASRT